MLERVRDQLADVQAARDGQVNAKENGVDINVKLYGSSPACAAATNISAIRLSFM
jgi:hypothetical protein